MWGRRKGGPKYGNTKTLDEASGITFDSKWEHECYQKLKTFEANGRIDGLEVQNRINLVVNEIKICAIVIDFTFMYQGSRYYLDSKSAATSPAGFRVKMKLFEAITDKKLHLVERKQQEIFQLIETGRVIPNTPKKVKRKVQ